MGYIEQNLLPGEQITYRARLHWAVFLRPLFLVILGLALLAVGVAAFELRIIGVVLILSASLFIIPVAIAYTSSEFAITDRRVMMKTGFVRRNSLELLLDKVEGVAVDQGIIGRMFDYGTIVVTGTGGLRTPFSNIAEPMEFRRRVYARIEKS